MTFFNFFSDFFRFFSMILDFPPVILIKPGGIQCILPKKYEVIFNLQNSCMSPVKLWFQAGSNSHLTISQHTLDVSCILLDNIIVCLGCKFKNQVVNHCKNYGCNNQTYHKYHHIGPEKIGYHKLYHWKSPCEMAVAHYKRQEKYYSHLR